MTKPSRFVSVWDAIEKPGEAANLNARAEIAHALIGELARRLDTMVELAGRVGFQVGIKISRHTAA